ASNAVPARMIDRQKPREGGAAAAARLRAAALDVGYSGNPVQAGIDFELPAAGLVVVAGRSGSGKTTLLRTLLGLLRPLAGSVRLDGDDLRSLPSDVLRRRVAYVPQGYELLSGKVRDALAMGRDVTDEELWRVLE